MTTANKAHLCVMLSGLTALKNFVDNNEPSAIFTLEKGICANLTAFVMDVESNSDIDGGPEYYSSLWRVLYSYPVDWKYFSGNAFYPIPIIYGDNEAAEYEEAKTRCELWLLGSPYAKKRRQLLDYLIARATHELTAPSSNPATKSGEN